MSPPAAIPVLLRRQNLAWPTADAMALAPEIATLTLLDAALRITEDHLLASNPELFEEPPCSRTYIVILAEALLGHLRATRAVLRAYRDQTLALDTAPDDSPAF